MPTTPDDRCCPRCGAPAGMTEGACSRCGFRNASPGADRGPEGRVVQPARARPGSHQVAGTVTSRVASGQHRPPEAAVAVLSVVVLAVCTVASASSLTSTPAVPSDVSTGLSGVLAAVLAWAAALLLGALVAFGAMLGPLLPLGMTLLIILVGIRIMLVPLIGLPGPRRMLPGFGGGLFTGVLGALVRTVVRVLIELFRCVGKLAQWLARQVLAPRASVTFTVTDHAGRPWQVRLLQEADGLGHGDTVQVRGHRVAGVLHARRVHLVATGVTLRSRTGAALPLTALLAALATASAASCLT